MNWVATFGLDKQSIGLVKLDEHEPYELFKGLYYNYDHVFMLESLVGPKEMAEFSIIGFDPLLTFTAKGNKVIVKYRDGARDDYKVEDPLLILKDLMANIKDSRFRYIGGAVGYICYDSINYWEDVNVKVSSYPSMEFGIYTDGMIFDHKNGKAYYFYLDKARIDDLKFEHEHINDDVNAKVSRNVSKDEFISMVEKAKYYIHEGDIYQVVLSKRFNIDMKSNDLKIYSNLRSINPSPYMYILKMGNRRIIGSSPEMLVRVINDKVETFPIAGTRPIGKDKAENERLKQELLSDEKELAEHTMLVDLARNDLGRVCRWGSVKVNDLMSIKEFSHVQHIVSHVVGRLWSDKDCYDSLKAVFPAGTVSGAPKVRAMEIIDELEKDARGPYAGALGYFSFNGSADFAITIRSLFINASKAYVQSGAGIVADSKPENEWLETEHKARALLDAIGCR